MNVTYSAFRLNTQSTAQGNSKVEGAELYGVKRKSRLQKNINFISLYLWKRISRADMMEKPERN